MMYDDGMAPMEPVEPRPSRFQMPRGMARGMPRQAMDRFGGAVGGALKQFRSRGPVDGPPPEGTPTRGPMDQIMGQPMGQPEQQMAEPQTGLEPQPSVAQPMRNRRFGGEGPPRGYPRARAMYRQWRPRL